MTFTFAAAVAWDPIGNKPVKNVSFQVYATTDTAYATPLAITDPFGNAIAGNILNSGSQGVFPQFNQATNSAVVITDPAHTYAWTLNAVMQDASVAAYISTPGSATASQLSATFVPKWKPNTAYLAGDKVLSPNGDVVSAIANFTSGTSYNAANWNISTTYAPTAHQGATTGVHGVGVSTVESTAGSASKVAVHAASATAHQELKPKSLVLPTNTGTVTDATVAALGFTPTDGHVFIDSQNGLRYTRIGGAWYGEQITSTVPFTPSSVTSASLWAWYDASQLTGLANNDPVASWTDMSGNGRHATQTQNTAYRPLYKTNVLNGKPGLLFDGVQSRLRIAGTPGNPFTVFLVGQFSSASSAASQYGYFDDMGHGLRVIFDGVTIQGIGPISASSPTFTPSGVVNDGTAKLLVGQFDGSANSGSTGFFIRANGHQGSTITAAEGSAVTQVWLGAGNNAGSGLPASVLNGYLFEVVIFSGRMSAADIAAMETYLS